MRDKDKKNNEKEPDKDLTAAYTDEAWSEEYINELLYEDEIPARKHGALRHWRNVLSVNFDEPLSVKDQFVIMTVILLVSALLFSAVYLAAYIHGGHSSNEALAADTASDTAEVSNGKEQASSVSSSGGSEQSGEEKSIVSPLGKTRMITKTNDQIHYGSLILVNKKFRCVYDGENVQPVTEAPSEFYDVTDYTVSLDKSVITCLNEMLVDFSSIYGKTDIMIACGYRSSSMQAELYMDEKERFGEEAAELLVAPPGFSEHQTGFAFDLNLNTDTGEGGINYQGSDIYSWINKNCHKYGFIIRYPEGKEDITGYSYEPWHFRYVGKAAAGYMSRNGLTFEEFIKKVQSTSISEPLRITDGQYPRYIYYVKADAGDSTRIPVPREFGHEISGDNCGGFIVTVGTNTAE